MNKTNPPSATGSTPPFQAGSTAPGAGTNDIREIKPAVHISSGWEWASYLLIAVLLAGLLWAFLRWRRNRKPEVEPAPSIPPQTRARQKLEQALGLLSDPRLFCIAISDAIRHYLEERFLLHAPERTTEEFLQELSRSSHLLPDQKITLGQFLEQCDLVKFARFEPTESTLRELHGIALRLIDETEPVVTTASPAPPTPPTTGTPPSLPPTRTGGLGS